MYLTSPEIKYLKSLNIKEVNELLEAVLLRRKISTMSKVTKKKRISRGKVNKESKLFKKACEFRDQLVINTTPAERLLKLKLDELNVYYIFQKVIFYNTTFFIVDFYLPEHALIIELDGKHHRDEKQQFKDDLRTQNLSELGYDKLIRLTNEEVYPMSTEDVDQLIRNYKIRSKPKLVTNAR